MRIEIITHSWRYSRLLTYQLSSLCVLHSTCSREPPLTTVTVFFCPSDAGTARTVEHFATLRIDRLIWNWQPLSHPELANRAIGRNRAAKATRADLVWFADADYCVLPAFWDSLRAVLPTVTQPLFYPEWVKGTTHPGGIAAIQAIDSGPRLVSPPTENLIDQRFRKAIGGIQFVRGDVARARGYLDGQTKQLRPYLEGNWRPNVEDARFRRTLGTPGQPVNMPGLLRIRHGERGGPEHVVDF